MNKYLLLVLLLSACESDHQDLVLQPTVAQSDPDLSAYVIDSSVGSLNGIYVGMSESKLSSLGYPESRGAVILEGVEYVTVNVTLDDQVSLDFILDEGGKVDRFSTASSLVHDEQGVGVDTALYELKATYPKGRLLVGDEDGRFASFVNGSKVIFSLDKSKINDLCFDEPTEKCEIDEHKVKVERVVVSKYSG
jgi:hypothetical protein